MLWLIMQMIKQKQYFMRMMRGTGLEGLVGIKAVREGGNNKTYTLFKP